MANHARGLVYSIVTAMFVRATLHAG